VLRVALPIQAECRRLEIPGTAGERKGEIMSEKTAVENPQQSLTPEELIAAVQELVSRAPVVDPVADQSPNERRRLALIDQELVKASLSAMHATPEVQAALGRSDADIVAESNTAVTWSVAIAAARRFVDTLAQANEYRFERVGLTSKQTYYICRQLAKDHKHAQALAPHIAEMKRIIARGRRKQHPTPQTPAPAPQPTMIQ
jgi:septal ring factor EnvC (AmiA/AmiB activator)